MGAMDFGKLYFGELPTTLPRFGKYLEYGQELRFFSGESIAAQQGDGFIFYIKSGSFKITITKEDGTVTDFAYCHKDCILQTNPMLEHATLWDPADCVAVENSVVVRFGRQRFYELIQQDQELFFEYIDNASTYSSLLKQRILITANLQSSQRLLTWVDKLCQCSVLDSEGIYRIPCHMTQQQIADFLFIHVTTCNKLFSALNREKILQHRKGMLTIYDYPKLCKYIEHNLKAL